MHRLTSQPNCVIVKKFPFMQETKANNQYHYQHALGKDGRLSTGKNDARQLVAVWSTS